MSSSSSPIVLITGCTPGGMGHTLCLEFASHGCRVIATARRVQVLESFVSSIGLLPLTEFEPGQIVGLELDVTKSESITALGKSIESVLGGKIDILVNNAGVGCCYPLIETPMDRIRNVFDTNVFGVIEMTQMIAPMMIKQRSGKIINISSITTSVTTPWSGVYCASKGAIDQFSQALRMELQPFGIQVGVVKPGSIATNIHKAHLLQHSQDKALLPPTSAYLAYSDSIMKRGSHISPKSTRPEEYAANVVKMVLTRSSLPNEYYFGHLSLLFWFVSFLPIWIRQYIMSRQFNL